MCSYRRAPPIFRLRKQYNRRTYTLFFALICVFTTYSKILIFNKYVYKQWFISVNQLIELAGVGYPTCIRFFQPICNFANREHQHHPADPKCLHLLSAKSKFPVNAIPKITLLTLISDIFNGAKKSPRERAFERSARVA